ncbi:D-arabinono-1,4-lactone oxidase [Streptomyces sp. 3211]|uniref:D-arabinono-1,4-lactone oxidase n=1 Tax=Streptomyces sp. 3211 TaxID=1964449 RepID=UPI0009A54A97|nr:D-arabinono-1,4-lactone oxidase [Streptomyces sp. 3211]
MNWARNLTFSAARVHRPGSVGELRQIVRNGTQVRAVGSGHSFSPIADTVGDLIRLDGLPRIVEIDRVNSMVTVSAGMRYADIAPEINRAGFALANLAALPHVSVAGACATGTHGSGDTQRCLAAAVAGIQWIGPDGNLNELQRAADPEVFAGSVVALGALGIVTRLTLEIEPAFDLRQRVRQGISLDDVANRFDEIFSAAYSASVFTDWHSGSAMVWLKQRTDQPTVHLQVGEPLSRPVHPTPGISSEACTQQLGVVGPWHERLPHFRAESPMWTGNELQSEYFLPRDQAGSAFSAIREIADLLAPILLVAEVRTVRADDLWLSPAYGRDSVTFHFTWIKNTVQVLPILQVIEERLSRFSARPHWGKITAMAPSDVTAHYQRADGFENLLRTYDPDGKFRNQFIEDHFPGVR